jgi:uncharacterized protein YejL (UPF0352 family)
MVRELSCSLYTITTLSSPGERKESIMTTNSGQATSQDRLDPVLEELLKEMIEIESKPKAASRAEEAVTTAMAEALMVILARTVSEASPFERSLLVAALAPALAEALAPALAEALAPALVTALSNMAAPKQTRQVSAPSGGSYRQEGA